MEEQEQNTDQTKPAMPAQSQPATDQSGYGKKGSMWKWILIYLVIAIVVYGGIWYYYHNKNASSGSTTNSLY
jgi:flagellar basal body-associated protein FliL